MREQNLVSEGPLVTIGIPTYNRVQRTLPEALSSALAQTYPNLEVVVSDNASEDGTEEFMASQHDARLRYHRHPVNVGANANFNACLDLAQGRYFLLLLDDDLLDSTFIARAVEALAGSDPGVVLGGTQVIDAMGRIQSRAPAPAPNRGAAGLFLDWFSNRASFYLFSTLFATDRLREIGGFTSPEALFQDVIAIARLAGRYGYVSAPGDAGAFRRHEHNLGGAVHPLRWTRDSEYLLDVICAEMPAEADRLRSAGAPYLAAKCYRYVPSVPSLMEQWRLYREIDRRFGHAYSPWAFASRYYRKRPRAVLASWLRSSGLRRVV